MPWMPVLAFPLALAVSARAPVQPDPSGLTPLFNGRDLHGWVNANTLAGTWSVKDGELVCSGHPTGYLRTRQMHENFVLELEWKHLDPHGNSGVFVWADALPAKGQPFPLALEVQVMLGGEGETYTSQGDIFPIHGATLTPENPRPKAGQRAFPTENRTKGAGEWNHYRIECRDGAISLAVNGAVVTRGSGASLRKGYICLESEGSEVHFRNIRIQDLPAATPPIAPTQCARPDDGFVPLFAGDFAGWKFGPAHEGHWKADDWKIAFDGQGEDLWTTRSYRDFILIADWRWPTTADAAPEVERPVILPSGDQAKDEAGKPKTQKVRDAGDSGLYLRGSSKSQVNIWCWPVGSGEVYGYRTDSALPPDVRAAITPRVRADAPIGQWNRFVIRLKKDQLTVVLNDQDVITNAALPGVAREGPIALQKHDSRIEFANLFIKEVEVKE